MQSVRRLCTSDHLFQLRRHERVALRRKLTHSELRCLAHLRIVRRHLLAAGHGACDSGSLTRVTIPVSRTASMGKRTQQLYTVSFSISAV